MLRGIDSLEQEKFDILIVGGGITGAFLLWDCVLRGYKTALVEKNDFGHGTSSATSKLIHGGLRYLENYQFGVVRESLRERRTLMGLFPHIATPLPFLLPVYKTFGPSKWLLKAGLTLYDILSYDRNDQIDPEKFIPSHRWVKRSEVLAMEPTLSPEGLIGAFEYYDVINRFPERALIELLLTAEDQGGVVANYVEATRLHIKGEEKGIIDGVECLDHIGNRKITIKTKTVINACGPWADLFLRNTGFNVPGKLIKSKGIHLIFNKIHGDKALTFTTRDNRHFFVIPWNGYTLVGTTDEHFSGSPDQVYVSKQEARELIDIVNSHYPLHLELRNVVHSYAGVRPLFSPGESSDTYRVSRDHKIVSHGQQGGPTNLYSVFGGKWTTSRALAAEILDLVEKNSFRKKTASRTGYARLVGGKVGTKYSIYFEQALKEHTHNYDRRVIHHLVEYYGSNYHKVLQIASLDPRHARKIKGREEMIIAEVVYAIEQEAAITLEDFLKRRSFLGNCGIPAKETLDDIATVFADKYKWKAPVKGREIQKYIHEQSIR